MTQKSISRSPSSGPPASERRTEGNTPRNRPVPDLDAAPPQPDAPEQSAVEEQQDQDPVQPEPLLNPHPEWPEPQREIRNG